DRELVDQLLRAVEHAGHVGEQQKTLGLERSRDGARKCVGVDVEGAAVRRCGDGRQHRDKLASDDLLQHADVDLLGLAHETAIDDFFVVGARVEDLAARFTGEHEMPSLPQSPTAHPPASLICATICLLMDPASTISTISMVAASVTRSPAANSDLMPNL